MLHRGHWYSPAPFPTYRERGDERHCYANATRHSRAYHLIYVEGYAPSAHYLRDALTLEGFQVKVATAA